MIHFAKARPSLVWQERQEEADRYLRSFAVIWETMAQVLQLEISDAAIVRATSSGSMGPIREDIPRDVWAPPHVSLIKAKSSKFSGGDKSFYGSILDILFEIFGDGFNGAASKVGLPFRFDLENPFALKWIEAASATLVREISDETMMAIRDLVLTAYRDRIPPQKAIDMVRDVIGLTQRQAATVTRFGQRLERNPANMIPGYDRMTPAEQRQQIDTRKKAYHTRKLRERAFTIARTETIRALDEGQRQSWKMAQEEGFLAPDAVRTWVASPGSLRTCVPCRNLHGSTAGINEPFEGADGVEVMGAPRHTSCRCRTVVAFEFDIPPVTGERLENLNEQARQFRVAAAKARRNRLKNLQYLRSRPNPQRQMRNIPGFEGARAT